MGNTDCSTCAGLCCVALAFDRGPHFAFDKPAGTPCPHLTPEDRCGIHHDLENRGLGGCARYDCSGAGPAALVTIRRSWREGPAAARALFDAFSVERDVADARALLGAARGLSLSPCEEARRAELEAALHASTWPVLEREIRTFLRGLRKVIRRRPPPARSSGSRAGPGRSVSPDPAGSRR